MQLKFDEKDSAVNSSPFVASYVKHAQTVFLNKAGLTSN